MCLIILFQADSFSISLFSFLVHTGENIASLCQNNFDDWSKIITDFHPAHPLQPALDSTTFKYRYIVIVSIINISTFITVAINELLCTKNAGAQVAMDFS